MRALALLVALAASAVSAQTQNYSSSLDMQINPESVAEKERAGWCLAQSETCGTLCGPVKENTCFWDSLTYNCTCASNSSRPGLQYYSQTLPSFICDTLFSQCNEQMVGNANGQKDCKNKIQALCGKLPPPKVSTTSSTTNNSSSAVSTGSAKQATDSSSASSVTSTSTSKGFAVATALPPANMPAAAAALGFLAYLL